jgi:protein SCO1/2
MSWRLASRLAVVTSAVLVIIVLVVVFFLPKQSAPTLQGTDLGSTNAPDFRLTDQFGNAVSLSQFRGHPVVLTFLYTHCPDQCPLIADKIHLALEKVGSKSSDIGVLAVSTDPVGDTQAAAYQFSKEHNLLNQMHFLIGTKTQLAPIWSDYGVSAEPATPTPSSPGTVNHTIALYLIDKQGHERILFSDDSFDPSALASDLQILLNE